jgi:hypothetical protein
VISGWSKFDVDLQALAKILAIWEADGSLEDQMRRNVLKDVDGKADHLVTDGLDLLVSDHKDTIEKV